MIITEQERELEVTKKKVNVGPSLAKSIVKSNNNIISVHDYIDKYSTG